VRKLTPQRLSSFLVTIKRPCMRCFVHGRLADYDRIIG